LAEIELFRGITLKYRVSPADEMSSPSFRVAVFHLVPLSPQAATSLQQLHTITGKSDLASRMMPNRGNRCPEQGECCAQYDGIRHQGGYLWPRVPSHGVQCAGRVRAVVGDGYRTADEPQGTQQRARRLYPQCRVPRKAPDDRDLVEPVSGGEPRGPCDAA